MIVQTTAAGQPNFVIKQIEHCRMSGQLAEAFGNKDFASLQPLEPMGYVVGHHDEGWKEIDDNAQRDPNTNLPYHLTQTPILSLIASGDRSPNFNEQHHPFSGLISSMHTYGLYHGRYGLSTFMFIEKIPTEHKAKVEAMLQGELTRQERLKKQLAASPEMKAWVDEKFIFHNYKLLQFFDTLSLYFHTTHEEARGETKFINVPKNIGDDVIITINKVESGVYSLVPYPFQQERFTVEVHGRYLAPLAAEVNVSEAVNKGKVEKQVYTLVKC